MEIFDYICLVICCIHILFNFIDFIRGKLLGKKIDKLCEKCGEPIYVDSSVHECWNLFSSLPKDELTLIVGFIDYLRSGDKNG